MSRKEMWLTLVTASLDLRLVEETDLLVVDAPPEVWLNGLWQLTIAIWSHQLALLIKYQLRLLTLLLSHLQNIRTPKNAHKHAEQEQAKVEVVAQLAEVEAEWDRKSFLQNH